MSATRFRVRLSAVRALNLPAKDRNGTSDPFFRFSFDNFKTGKSEVVKRDCSPTWDYSVSFVYETQYLDRLKDKMFDIEVYDHDRFKRADFIGGAQVSLHDIAHGPTMHQLVLRDQHRNPAGKIYFTLEMDLWNDITVGFSDLVLNMNAAHVREMSLELFFTHNREDIIRTPTAVASGSAPPTWHDAPLLVFNSKFHTYSTGSFTLQVMSRALGRVAIGHLPISSLTSSKLNRFRIPVHPTGEGGPASTLGHIEGTVHIKNAPTFGQLASGVHTDKGVFHDIQDASGGNPVMSTLASLSGPPPPPKDLPQMPMSPLSSSVSSLVPSAPPMPMGDVYPPIYPPEQSLHASPASTHHRPLSTSGPRPISMNATGHSDSFPGVYPPSLPSQHYPGSGSPAPPPVAGAYGRRPSGNVYPPTNVSSHGTGGSVGSHGSHPSPTVGLGVYPPGPPANYSPSSVYPPPFYATQQPHATNPSPYPPTTASVYPPSVPSTYPPPSSVYPPPSTTSPGPYPPTSPYSNGSVSPYPPSSPYPPMPSSPYPPMPTSPYPNTGGGVGSPLPAVYPPPPSNSNVYPPPSNNSVYPPPSTGGVYPLSPSVYPPPPSMYNSGGTTSSGPYPPSAGGVYPPSTGAGYYPSH